jgi:hypothetical protein
MCFDRCRSIVRETSIPQEGLLHIAMQIGLYHPQPVRFVQVAARRAVSEDSPGCDEPSVTRPYDREPFLLIVRTSRFVTATRVAST